MKDRMLRYAASAFVLAASLLYGCKGEENQPVLKAAPQTPEQSLGAYAASLVSSNQSMLAGKGPSIKTVDSPLSYLTNFTTNDASMLTRPVREGRQEDVDANLAVTNRWQALYCTQELQAIMARHKIFVASGRIYDDKGQGHSVAMCVAKSTS